VNACNQKTNREPVTNYDDDTVADALASLREKRFSLTVTGGSRVNKYQQRISETLNLGRRESAVLCVLLLRGPQTLGEIKDRGERMFSFADLAETEAVLDKLGPLVKKLPRFPGQKEARYVQLLSGEPDLEAMAEPSSAAAPTRIAQLEEHLRDLRDEFNDLKRRFETLESQLR
jgi:uncharacterized protein YceH (UPF0502 family)